jgi:hypothetical protein
VARVVVASLDRQIRALMIDSDRRTKLTALGAAREAWRQVSGQLAREPETEDERLMEQRFPLLLIVQTIDPHKTHIFSGQRATNKLLLSGTLTHHQALTPEELIPLARLIARVD